VNNWGKATFTPTNTNLALTVPANTTHGTAVPIAISVSPASGSGTPTGDVALLVNPGTSGATPPNAAIDWFNLVNGAANCNGACTTSLLPGGTHTVVAHYEGDTTFGGSYSNTASVTVNPENSTVIMPGVDVGANSSDSPVYSTSVVYGSGGYALYTAGYPGAYWLRADVYSLNNGICTTPAFGEVACPTGTISFTVDGNPLGTYALNSYGYTEEQAIQLTGTPPGTPHTLVANYSGDNSYNASSATATVTVTPAPTTIAKVASPSTANAGTPFTVTATVTSSSYGVAPTGTVKFFYGTTLLGTATTIGTPGSFSSGVTASLAATLSASIPTAGTYNITATYTSLDSNYASQSSSNSVSITVNSSTTPGFTLSAAPGSLTIAPGGTGGTSTISVTDVGGFTGSVGFAASGLPSGVTASFNPTSSASSSVLTLTASSSATAGGPTTVTITGTSGALTATTTVALTVSSTAAPFTIGSIANMTISAPGQSGTTQVTLTSVGGFTGPVSIACSLPTSMTGATCPTVNATVPANGSVNATVMISTAAAGAAIRVASTGMLGFGVLAGVFVFAIPGLRRRKAPLALLLFGLVVLIVSCGGGSSAPPPSSPGTPVGTYTVNLTATGGGSSVPASFSATVQ